MSNRAKDKLARGECVTMINPNYPAPGLVETLGRFGFDIAFVDCEHGPHHIETVENMARAARAAGINTVVRPDSEAPHTIIRYLDRGMDGVMVPHVDTVAMAEKVVETVRYARFANYQDTLVICMVESPEAVRNIDDILKVDGIDVFFVGPGDLSSTMGYHGQRKHPEVLKLVDHALARITGAGRTAGTLVGYDDVEELLDKGVRYLYIHANSFLAHGAQAFRALLPAG